MDAARRQALSEKAKQRWAESKEIAPLLEMSTETVHNKYAQIKDLIPRIKEGEVEAIEEAKRIIAEGPAKRVRIYQQKRTRDDGEEELTPADELRIGMWFIKKIGDPDRAIDVLKLAAQATKKLS